MKRLCYNSAFHKVRQKQLLDAKKAAYGISSLRHADVGRTTTSMRQQGDATASTGVGLEELRSRWERWCSQ